LVKCNLTKLTTMSLVVKWSASLVVKRSTSLAVKQFVILAVKRFVSLVLKRPTSSVGIQRSIPTYPDQRVRHRVCSGAVHLASSPHPIPYFFSPFHCFISVACAWNGGSWLGCGDLPAMGAVFYPGAGWPQWKSLGIPGTLLPLM